MSWIDVGDINDIPVRGARLVKTHLGCVALFRTKPDEVFATSNVCPHKNGPLVEGIVHDQKVTCPLHNWVFDLNTGAALGEEGQIDTFPVQLENGRVLLDATAVGARSAA